MSWVRTRSLVLVSWDGQSEPWSMIHLDAAPEFDWILFDFSGRQAPGPRTLRGQPCLVLAGATECKGEIYQALADYLAANSEVPDYVSLIDDDILLSVSDINRMLHLATCEGLDICSPALSHDSVYTHRWTLRQPSLMFRDVDWVEVMMPFYRGSLFMAGREQYRGNVSSWGIDKYLMPTLAAAYRPQALRAGRCRDGQPPPAGHQRPEGLPQWPHRRPGSSGHEGQLHRPDPVAPARAAAKRMVPAHL